MKTRIIYCFISILLTGNLFAGVINNIQELDQAAVFHFALMSDNKGEDPSTSTQVARCDSFLKNSAIQPLFVLGLGDNLEFAGEPWLNYMATDSFWRTKFYPNVADGEDQHFSGSQSTWGAGRKIFSYVDDFWGRSNVQGNKTTEGYYVVPDADGNVSDYYAWFENSGYTVHVLSLEYSDSGPGLIEESRQFMQDKLNDLAVLKDTQPGKHIIIVLAHSTGGDFVEQANFTTTRKELLLATADVCVSATTHKYGWWDRYTAYDNGNAAVSYNSGSCGAAGGSNGYMEFHVLENPLRVTIQYIYTEVTSRQLHTGTYSDFSQDTGKYGTPIIKEIDGPWYEVDWNNIALTAPPNSSQVISETIPDTLMPGETKTVSVTMENTGTETWSTASNYKLGSVGDDSEWTGQTRISLPNSVSPDQQVTFTFDITAPTNIAPKDCQWRMVQEGVEWFGATAGNSVDVTWPLLNLVQNPSFEEDADSNGRPDNWGDDADYIRSADTMTDGSYSVKGTGSGNIGGISQTIALTQNTDYNLSVKINYTTGTGIAVFDTSDKFDATCQFNVNGPTSGWQTYTGSFNSGTETSVTLRTYTDANSGFSGTFYVDEVSLTTPGVYEPQNYAPEFTSTPPGEYLDVGETYTYNITTDDADGDPVTLTMESGPSWLMLSGSTLSGTPAAGDIGSDSVTLRAADELSHSDQVFTVSVSVAGNDVPVITSTPVTGVVKDNPYSYAVTSTDADGDTLTYTVPTKPSWMSISGNTLSGTPAESDAGLNLVVLNVSDGTDTAEQTFNVMVFGEAGGGEPAVTNSVTVAVSSNDDDLEELVANGDTAGSSDLEFIYDVDHMNNAGQTNGDQLIGLRFQNVSIPNGATVTRAYVQFTGDSSSGAGDGSSITLNIAGEDSDNSAALSSTTDYDVSGRTKTSASVNWSPPAWSAGSAGSAEQSDDISSVVQEIVNRGGWSSGNSLSLIISGTEGLGSAARRAEAFDGAVAGAAPELYVEYVTGGSGGANLIQNGSFEIGASWPDNWSQDANAVWASSGAQDGSRCMSVPVDIGAVSQDVAVQNGQTYNLSVWINAAGYATTLDGIAVFDSSDKYDDAGQCQFVINDVNDANGWTQFTGSFTATNTETVTFRMFSTATLSGAVLFDNISLTGPGGENIAPAITSVPITEIDEGDDYSYQLLAADAENDTLTFSGDTVPAGLSFDAGSGLLTGSSMAADTYNVVLSVSDGELSTNQSFTITVTANLVAVPNVVGQAQAAAEGNITGAGLVVGNVATAYSGSVPAGDVISQNPTGGASVAIGSSIDLVISLGVEMVSVPNVVGQAQAAAEGNITGAGLSVGTVTTANSDTVPAGDVISQNPAGGASVAIGSSVDLVVSLGPVLTAYEQWQVDQGVDDNVDTDPDNDGDSNFSEYVLGGDPDVPGDVDDPVLADDAGTLKYSYQKRNDDPTLIYKVQVCNDLIAASWQDVVIAPETNSTDGAYSDVSHTIPTTDAQSYIRLRVDSQ